MNTMKSNGHAWWVLPAHDVITHLQTDQQRGLSAQQVRERLKQYGHNRLPQAPPPSALVMFARQFMSIVVGALAAAVVISWYLGEYVDALAVSAIILINAVIGFAQEYSAEKTIRGLQQYIQQSIQVIRDGIRQEISVEQLVPGDIVELVAGDKVPADGRIIDQAHLSIDQAALTGESIAVHKQSAAMELTDVDAGIADQTNMVFMGTSVMRGTAQVVVTATGSATQLGGIAQLLSAEHHKQTSFEQEVLWLEKLLVTISLLLVIIVFVLGLVRGYSLSYLALTTISLAVAAIPEGLPVVTTVALAYGLRIMARKQVIIRRLHAVETLGSTSVICTDKTGTITHNRMTAVAAWVPNTSYTVTADELQRVRFVAEGLPVAYDADAGLQQLLQAAALATGAQITQKNGITDVIGDPTEGATLLIAHQAGVTRADLLQKLTLIDQRPFESDRKLASYLYGADTVAYIYLEGAPEVIIDRCVTYNKGGSLLPFDQTEKAAVAGVLEQFANRALRVVAFAYKPVSLTHDREITTQTEHELVFLGLMGLEDPPREQVRQALELCKQAGIHVMMITGDHEQTATAIARQVGLIDTAHPIVLHGTAIERLSDEQLQQQIDQVAVCARTTAEHKMRIVHALQAQGNTVAMTGDGVNDAPAIKAADVGVAMGITGTDVSKEASDIVILDDNFASIVAGVTVGRAIFDNIKKFVNYLLSSNLIELLVIATDILLLRVVGGQPYVSLLPIHILWINLVTDGFPALALAIDPASEQVMKQSVKQRSRKLLPPRILIELVSIAVTLAVITLIVSHYGVRYGVAVGRTMAFTLLVVLEFVRLYTIRAEYALTLFSNPWLIVACFFSLVCQLCVIYIPWLQTVFKTAPLNLYAWIIIIAAVGVGFIATRLVRWSVRFFIKPEQSE